MSNKSSFGKMELEYSRILLVDAATEYLYVNTRHNTENALNLRKKSNLGKQ
jgi:hypothetical protein